jgi:hypothetical protein
MKGPKLLRHALKRLATSLKGMVKGWREVSYGKNAPSPGALKNQRPCLSSA